MATRLRISNRKRHRDKERAYKAGEAPNLHKISKGRSKKAKFKKAFRMV